MSTMGTTTSSKPGFVARYWKAIIGAMGSGLGAQLVQVAMFYFPTPGTPPADPITVRSAIASLLVGLLTGAWVAKSAANAVTASSLVAQAAAQPGAKKEIREAAARVSSWAMAAVVAATMAASVAGCAWVPGRGVVAAVPNPTSPTQLVAAAQASFSEALTYASAAHEQGLLSQKIEDAIDKVVDRTAPALTAANTAARGGTCTDPGPDPSYGGRLLACWQKWLAIGVAGVEQIRHLTAQTPPPV